MSAMSGASKTKKKKLTKAELGKLEDQTWESLLARTSIGQSDSDFSMSSSDSRNDLSSAIGTSDTNELDEEVEEEK